MKHDVLIKAIDALKKSEFKATAIKFEFEAQLNRGHDDESICDNCGGDWEGSRCYNECEDGRIECEVCEGSNERTVGEGDEAVVEDCDSCEEEGYYYCEECNGSGYYDDCDYCEEGRVDDGMRSNFGNAHYCHEWVMEKLSEIGLAERKDELLTINYHDTYWHPKAPLVYAKFYNDGSVDSELTLTLSIKDSQSILLVPKIMEIFTDLASEVGNGIDTRGAGMHIALINDKNGKYPSDSVEQTDKFINYSKNMQLLLPALYFLGSANDTSRALRFRNPRISNRDKYSAIYYKGGAIEFRLFDTCYDQPDVLFDDIIVIANTMKYWRSKPMKHAPLEKITKTVLFGKDNSNKLERFYACNEHLDLLNRGLLLLKPAYKTISELKKERKFSLTKRVFNNQLKNVEKEAVVTYKEYVNRYEWRMVATHHMIVRNEAENLGYSNTAPTVTVEEHLQALEERAKRHVEEERKQKRSLADYVADKIEEVKRQSVGDWRIGV